MKFSQTQVYALMLLAFLSLVLIGCSGKKVPDVIAASGMITINGTPLPHAEVKFYPTEPGIDGSFIATAISDDEGKFTLKLMGQQESGVCVGKNQVTVMDGPLPDEAREDSERAVQIANEFLKKLKNRPIPPAYVNLVTSPLQVEVTRDQTEYKLELTR